MKYHYEVVLGAFDKSGCGDETTYADYTDKKSALAMMNCCYRLERERIHKPADMGNYKYAYEVYKVNNIDDLDREFIAGKYICKNNL